MTLLAEPTQPVSWISATLVSVGMHGGLAMAAFGAFPDLFPDAPAELPEPQAFTVTSISLDTDQIEAIETLTDPGSGEDPPDAEAPEALEPAEPDQLAAIEPVDPPASLPPTEIERPEPVTARPPEAIRPVAPQPAQAQTLSPIRAETGAAIQTGPAPAEPLANELTPVPPTTEAEAAGEALPEALAPVEIAALPPPAPPAGGAAISDDDIAQEEALQDLIERIRREGAAACFAAFPQRSADGQVRLLLIGDDRAAMSTSADTITAGMEAAPDRDAVLIDPRQCAALDFVRSRSDYPAFSLSLGLTSDAIASGARLTGSIRRTGGRAASLILIDDNGVVQDLARFTAAGAGVIWFDVPMTRSGEARGTSQLLLALATPSAPRSVAAQDGRLAQEFFPALDAELAEDTPLALVPFDLR